MTEIITIVAFSNILGFFILFMCGSNQNIKSRTEREYQMLIEDQEKKEQN
jgi:hypothetical protein